MNRDQANKRAAQQSKTDGPHYVVWVFDQGREVFNAEQARRYAPLIQVDAAYVDGIEVAKETA